MKKIFLVLILSTLFSLCGIAQNYSGYKPCIPSRSTNANLTSFNSNQLELLESEPAPKKVRATAYYLMNNNVYKLPIRILVNVDQLGRVIYYVTDYYYKTNFSVYGEKNDNWHSISPTLVRDCDSSSAFSQYKNPLETKFMYKAIVIGSLISGQLEIFFDL